MALSRKLFPAMLVLATLPVAVAAQDSSTAAQTTTTDQPAVTAEQVIDQAKDAYGPPPPKGACKPGKPGEIVVCGGDEDQSQFRVKSSGELDPTGAGARDGVPHAPDLEPKYPGPVVARGCFIPPCPPPKAVLIDLKAIPEAPPGSDAERVGQGLPPKGDDNEGSPLPQPQVPVLTTTPPPQ